MSNEQTLPSTDMADDYIERTIATVRNHRDSENSWPQWANVLADEVERLVAERDQLRETIGIALTIAEDANRAYRLFDVAACLRKALAEAEQI